MSSWGRCPCGTMEVAPHTPPPPLDDLLLELFDVVFGVGVFVGNLFKTGAQDFFVHGVALQAAAFGNPLFVLCNHLLFVSGSAGFDPVPWFWLCLGIRFFLFGLGLYIALVRSNLVG